MFTCPWSSLMRRLRAGLRPAPTLGLVRLPLTLCCVGTVTLLWLASSASARPAHKHAASASSLSASAAAQEAAAQAKEKQMEAQNNRALLTRQVTAYNALVTDILVAQKTVEQNQGSTGSHWAFAPDGTRFRERNSVWADRAQVDLPAKQRSATSLLAVIEAIPGFAEAYQLDTSSASAASSAPQTVAYQLILPKTLSAPHTPPHTLAAGK